MVSGDIRNAFHCSILSPRLGRYFSLPCLSARAAGLVGGRAEGRTLSPSDSVSRFPASLLMSFSWGMYLLPEQGIPLCILFLWD